MSISELKPYDTHHQLLVAPYKNGIQLVFPKNHLCYINSISSLYSMPEPWYFMDRESNFIDGNEDLSKLVNAMSVTDMHGKNSSNFCSREFSDKLLANDEQVIRTQSSMIVEEHGSRRDDITLHALAIKFPWYYNDKIIGLLGCSIMVKSNSMVTAAASLTRIMQCGLLGNKAHPPLKEIVTAGEGEVYYSKRERDVIKLLVQGISTKDIANTLFIAKRTVEHHIENIKHKANCRTRYELIYKLTNPL